MLKHFFTFGYTNTSQTSEELSYMSMIPYGARFPFLSFQCWMSRFRLPWLMKEQRKWGQHDLMLTLRANLT